MKGTRTYQIVGFVVIIALVNILSIVGIDIQTFLKEFESILSALVGVYVATLAAWKLVAPHPMKHEKTNE